MYLICTSKLYLPWKHAFIYLIYLEDKLGLYIGVTYALHGDLWKLGLYGGAAYMMQATKQIQLNPLSFFFCYLASVIATSNFALEKIVFRNSSYRIRWIPPSLVLQFPNLVLLFIQTLTVTSEKAILNTRW